ncbi:MAG: hypothetical protein V5A52_01870 [Halovenus sp.]
MELQRLAGLTLAVAGLVGYVAGIYTAYPGRSFSIMAVMVGITLAAISRERASEAVV